MKNTLIVISLCCVAAVVRGSVRNLTVEGAPFPLTVAEWTPPAREFQISDFGAKPGDVPVTEAVQRAIDACAAAGGGRVVVPPGRWTCGSIRLKSDVALALADGATLFFPDDPLLVTGRPLENGRPRLRQPGLICANDCSNIGILGPGTIEAATEYWHSNHRKNPKAGFPRPRFVTLDGCSCVRLEGFKVRGSPSWTLHLLKCRDIVLRGVDIVAHGPNSDGVDIDSCNRVLAERCSLNQGDDSFTIKSGKDAAGRKRNIPSENIAILDSVVARTQMLGIGSEVSGGVRNVWLKNCSATGEVSCVVRVKTNSHRGGFVENVWVEDISAVSARRAVFEIDATYDGNPVKELTRPNPDPHYTRIENINVRNMKCGRSKWAVRVIGDEHLPPRAVTVEDLSVDKLTSGGCQVKNAPGLVLRRVSSCVAAPREISVRPVEGDATATLQRAFDECFLGGGGTVTVERGVYDVKGLRLRSNTTLLLKNGAMLKASRDCDDYDILAHDAVEPVPGDLFAPGVVWVRPKDRKTNDHLLKPASRWNNAIIRILNARNVQIIGEPGSEIDGCDSYDPIGEEHFRGVHGISVHASTNLLFRGYTIRNTGNWAHNVWNCADLQFERLEILGGHDGIHMSVCDRVSVADCKMKTGDDCVAGFDNEDVTVRNCVFNTACSAFRFGGRRVLAENCHAYGPGEYPIRNSLPKEDRISGSHGVPGAGRRTMLSLFTYYSDFTIKVRHVPGDITVRNCRLENAERFLHYNFSGNETWQKNRPLGSILFEGVDAKDVGMSLCAYGDANEKLSLAIRDCRISFAARQREFIKGAHIGTLELEGVSVDGVDGPCVRSWGDVVAPAATGVTGIDTKVIPATEPFRVKSI